MPSLTDIAPATATVTVAGVEFTVRALSVKDMAQIFLRYPAIAEALNGRDLRIIDVLGIAPDAVGAAIAAALGKLGDAEEEAAAAQLLPDVQADFIEAIIELTMPNGVAPFVERLKKFYQAQSVGGNSGKAPATKSPPP